MKILSSRNINTLFIATAVILLLYFLWAYSETGSPPEFSSQPVLNKQAEFYINNPLITQFNQQGALDSVMHSEQIRQNPADNSVDITQPQLNLFRNGEPSWTIKAQTGTIYNKGNTVDLQQQVTAVTHDRQTVLNTPQMLVFPNQQTAHTDKPVTLKNHNGFTRAIGLQADLNTRQIDLLNNVRGLYEPQAIADYVE